MRSRSASSTRSLRASCTIVTQWSGSHSDQQCFPEIAEADVNRSGGEQHQEHRLSENFECDLPNPAPSVLRKLICTVGHKTPGRFVVSPFMDNTL